MPEFLQKIFFSLLILAKILCVNNASAQSHLLPPNQPEQDACNALILCGNTFYTPYSYSGAGRRLDLASTPCFPSTGGGEINSMWLKIKIDAPGKLAFKIISVDQDDDYDFAVLDATDGSCDFVTPQDVVRCNFAANPPGVNYGITGLSDTSLSPYITQGDAFSEAIDVNAGDIYLIMINNYGHDSVGGSASAGFTIDFTSSTALFNNNTALSFSNIDVPCSNATSITLSLSTQILCSSIAGDGSDFGINAPVNIISAEGINCTDDSGYTNTIIIHFSFALPPGDYTLSAKNGSDGNTLLNLCNNPLALPGQIDFTILSFGKQVTVDETICKQQLPYVWNGITVTNGGNDVAEYKTASVEGCDSTTILNLNVLPFGKQVTIDQSICYEQLPYIWNGISVTKAGNDVDEYKTTTAGGCDSTTILNLTVGNPPLQSSLTKAKCLYQSYTLPWDSTVNSTGTYTHHYTNAAGCDSLIEKITVIDSACKNYVYIPTAFTPNTDKRNDIFKPIVSGTLLQYQFKIYNRWGKEIFSSNDFLRGWNGTVNGLLQPAGTYVWMCKFQLLGEPAQIKRGTVTLIR